MKWKSDIFHAIACVDSSNLSSISDPQFQFQTIFFFHFKHSLKADKYWDIMAGMGMKAKNLPEKYDAR